MQRNWKLDAIRATAILLVLFAHTASIPDAPHPRWLWLLGHRGPIGVDIFFVLSGWLIGGQVFRIMQRDRKFDIGRFWVRRWIRTLPAYYAMLLIVCLIPIAESHPVLPDMIFFTQNYSAPLDWGITWSLCIEEHFYLILPLILWGLPGRPRVAIIVGVFFLVFSPIYRLIMAPAAENWTFAFGMQTHMRLDGLVMGVVMSALNEYRTSLWMWLVRHAKVIAIFGGIVFLAFSYNPWAYDWTPDDYRSYFGMVPASFGVSLGVALLLPLSATVPATSSTWWQRILTWIAEHAYTLYLTHVIVFFWVLYLAGSVIAEHFPSHAYLVAITSMWACSFAAAILLRACIEKPGLRFRDWLESKWKTSVELSNKPI
jgi:peptidoglycan/LPS O-acetylase OafA/YrhL